VADRDLTLMKNAGFRWVKQWFAWDDIEGAGRGQYDWSIPDRIVRQAREEATAAATEAKAALEVSLERRLKAAEEQIASAEQAAVRAVRDRAVQVAIAAAGEALAKGMTPEAAEARIAASIREVEAKLH
jgi:hypothetical protein